MRFLCDEMLTRLGRWLRIAGYDAVSCPRGTHDNAVLARALDEDRVLLSADRGLVARVPEGHRALLVPDARLKSCVPLLERELGVDWELAPWSRCVECNVPIERYRGPAPEYAPRDLELFVCPSCGRVFWEGAHATRFANRLRRLRGEPGAHPKADLSRA